MNQIFQTLKLTPCSVWSSGLHVQSACVQVDQGDKGDQGVQVDQGDQGVQVEQGAQVDRGKSR